MTLQELVKNVTMEEVGSQAFRYTPKNWIAYPRLPDLLAAAAYCQDQIVAGFTLSRSEVRGALTGIGGVGELALVPVWGYPRGAAGSGNRKPLEAVFDNAERITKTLIECNGRRLPTNRILDAFAIPHIGLSTLSKILYFSGLENHIPAGPLWCSKSIGNSTAMAPTVVASAWPSCRTISDSRALDSWVWLRSYAACPTPCPWQWRPAIR